MEPRESRRRQTTEITRPPHPSVQPGAAAAIEKPGQVALDQLRLPLPLLLRGMVLLIGPLRGQGDGGCLKASELVLLREQCGIERLTSCRGALHRQRLLLGCLGRGGRCCWRGRAPVPPVVVHPRSENQ